MHLCAGLLLFIGSIALSGAALVWKAPLDAFVHPGRYAITPGDLLPPSIFVSRVTEAGFEPMTVQFDPARTGPVMVIARRDPGTAGARPDFMTAYLDSTTGGLFDIANNRASWFGLLHRFHEKPDDP